MLVRKYAKKADVTGKLQNRHNITGTCYNQERSRHVGDALFQIESN